MTGLGHRPTLQQLLAILGAITKIEADERTLDPEAKEFSVILTFSREWLSESAAADWGDGQPKPTWFIEELKEQFAAWYQQRVREEQWVSKEDQYGASIDTIMAHWTEELKRVSNAAIQTITTRVQTRIISNTIMRLQELKERRTAGAVYSATEDRREKARKTWVEDEYEAPKREEEQRRQRERQSGFADEGATEEVRRQAEEFLRRHTQSQQFRDFFYGGRGWRTENPPPPTGNKRPWHTVLGVSSDATTDQIEKAYRRLAKRFHPDHYKEADGHEKMVEINLARTEARESRGL